MKDYSGNSKNTLCINDRYTISYAKFNQLNITKLEIYRDNTGEHVSLDKNINYSLYRKLWNKKIKELQNSYIPGYKGDSINFLTWTIQKYKLNGKSILSPNILDKNNDVCVKKYCIYWIDFGFNIGSELRKERPAIIWKKMKNGYFVLPCTSKDKGYSTHVKLENKDMFITLEQMRFVSVKRISKGYFDGSKIFKISEVDKDNIKESLHKFLKNDE